jgi:DNA-binding NarL/FixJ family response regulator
MQKLKILIIDDHKMIRDGIRFMLESNKKYGLSIEEAIDGYEGFEKTKNNEYDIIIMDYQLPRLNGADTTRMIISNKPESKILALSNYNEFMYIDNIIAAGAKGFVLKNIGPEELINAIEAILNDKNYYSNDVAIKLINFKNDGYDKWKIHGRFQKVDSLSKREMEILKLIVSEFTNEEIAIKLFLSKRTVDTHRQNLLNKLRIKNTAGLVKYAMELFSSEEEQQKEQQEENSVV